MLEVTALSLLRCGFQVSRPTPSQAEEAPPRTAHRILPRLQAGHSSRFFFSFEETPLHPTQAHAFRFLSPNLYFRKVKMQENLKYSQTL